MSGMWRAEVFLEGCTSSSYPNAASLETPKPGISEIGDAVILTNLGESAANQRVVWPLNAR